MQSKLHFAVLIGAAITCSLASASEWETDFDKAQRLASATGKYLLVDFTGSDWCPWCIKLERRVFSTSAFRTFAATNFVRVMVDFPRGKQLPQSQQERNQSLLERYGVSGLPTVLVMSAVARSSDARDTATRARKHTSSSLEGMIQRAQGLRQCVARRVAAGSNTAGRLDHPAHCRVPWQ